MCISQQARRAVELPIWPDNAAYKSRPNWHQRFRAGREQRDAAGRPSARVASWRSITVDVGDNSRQHALTVNNAGAIVGFQSVTNGLAETSRHGGRRR